MISRIAILHEHITILYDHTAILHDHIAILHDHIAILHEHITRLHDHIARFHGHVTILHDHITIFYDHIIISKSKPKGTKSPFKPLPGKSQSSESKHSASSSKSAHKISKKTSDSRKKWTLLEDNGKSFGVKLRMLSSYTFYRRILQKPFLEKHTIFVILSKIRKNGNSELLIFSFGARSVGPPRSAGVIWVCPDVLRRALATAGAQLSLFQPVPKKHIDWGSILEASHEPEA